MNQKDKDEMFDMMMDSKLSEVDKWITLLGNIRLKPIVDIMDKLEVRELVKHNPDMRIKDLVIVGLEALVEAEKASQEQGQGQSKDKDKVTGQSQAQGRDKSKDKVKVQKAKAIRKLEAQQHDRTPQTAQNAATTTKAKDVTQIVGYS